MIVKYSANPSRVNSVATSDPTTHVDEKKNRLPNYNLKLSRPSKLVYGKTLTADF